MTRTSAALQWRRSSILLAGLLAASAAGGAEPFKEEPKAAWRTGPVRYILTVDEDKAYKALKTDDERAKAIEQFWSRRDPTPGTPQNEYKERFFKLVEEADKHFREGAGAGWTSDRGKVLLTAGSPDSKTGEGEDRESWLYAKPLPSAGKSGAAAKGGGSIRVAFQHEESGEYRLEGESAEFLSRLHELDPLDLAKFSMPAEALALKTGTAPKPDAAAATAGAAPAGAASGGTTPGGAKPAAAAVPPEIDRLRQATLGNEPKKDLPLSASVRYFKAEDGSTRTVVMVALKKADLTATPDGKPLVLLYARFTAKDAADAEPVEFLDEDLFHVYDDAKEGYFKYAFSWFLKRKSYDLRIAASDGKEGRIGTYSDTLSLPDFRGDALALSSVTLARAVVPVGADPAAHAAPPASANGAADDPWVLGAQRLVPWVTPSIGPGDDLSFFYDVYNAKRDPATNQPSIDVTYLFEKKETSGWKAKARIPVKATQKEGQGYTVGADELATLPAGDWRVAITVRDKVASAEASSTLEFSLRK